MILKATRSVLYRSTQYEAGDALPADNQIMVDAWLNAGSAAWKDDEDDPVALPKKAKRVTAPPGTTGISSDGDPEARVGRLPDKPERKTAPRKGKSKK